MDKITKVLTTDDLAWVSSKLNSEYIYAKTKPIEEKNCDVAILVYRALRFGLEELVSKFGYSIFQITLPNKRFARLVIPNDITLGDISIILHYLEMLTNEPNPERSVATEADSSTGDGKTKSQDTK